MRKMLISVLCIIILVFTCFTFQSIGEKINNQQPQISLDTDIINMIQQVDEDLVYYYHSGLMEFAPRYTGTKNCTLASEFLYDEFEKMGLDVEFHNWKYDGFQSRNVIATLNGTNPDSDAIFVICAHYDTVKVAPGANDDGSGVAVVLAVANITSRYSFNHTIRFICFSGEEVGTYGSFNYAKDAYEQGDNIIAVLNLDIVGWASTDYGGNIIRFSHEERSTWVVEFAQEVSDRYYDYFNMTVENMPNYKGADHQAFTDYGYDGVWIVEHDGHSYGHSENDTLEHINITYETKVAKLMIAILGEIANRPIDIQVVIKAPLEGHLYLFGRPFLPTHFGRNYWLGLRGLTTIIGTTNFSVEVKSEEEIKQVVFCIDDSFIFWDREPPYEWVITKWYQPLFGRHTLRVYAYTYDNKMASDEMDILLFYYMNLRYKL